MRIVLRVLSGPCKGLCREYNPAPALLRIGRDADCDFSLHCPTRQDRGISREHCRIEVSDTTCTLRDLGSNNHVRINDGVPTPSANLVNGDRIRLSRSTELQIEITAPAPEAETVDQESFGSFHQHFDLLPTGQCMVCTSPRPLRGEVCPVCREQCQRRPQPISGYLLLRELGKGGMGVVWLAEDRSTQELVAIKQILPERGTTSAQIRRFVSEIRYLHDLQHPNIVTTIPPQENRRQTDPLYLVMEYLPGLDGDAFLRRYGPLEVALAVRIVRDVLAGLAYAHAKQCIHRDLKPANILIVEEPWAVKLTDFGLAYQVESSSVTRQTQTQELGGTLPFLPPEQAEGMLHATAASDQYGMAATLYTLLTGKYVHDLPRTLPEQLEVIARQSVVPILQRRPDLSPALASVIHRALERKPENRFPDVAAFSRSLRPFSR